MSAGIHDQPPDGGPCRNPLLVTTESGYLFCTKCGWHQGLKRSAYQGGSMTIPASSIHRNPDGTAWVVRDGNGTSHAPADLMVLDRPCDTCDGKGTQGTQIGKYNADGTWTEWHEDWPCGDCDGTGRHTFTVEVEPDQWSSMRGLNRSLRVSIREGMVLPIVDSASAEWNDMDHHHIGMCELEVAEYWGVDLDIWEPRWVQDVCLPPDAGPGMWAVLLQVHE